MAFYVETCFQKHINNKRKPLQWRQICQIYYRELYITLNI